MRGPRSQHQEDWYMVAVTVVVALLAFAVVAAAWTGRLS